MDVEEVKKIVELMEEHNLIEVELEDKNGKIRLRKEGNKEIIGIPQVNNITVPVTAVNGERLAKGVKAEEGGKAEEDSEATHITAPVVGTFYRRSSPDSDVFVKVGDHIEEDTVVCIVEAMKVMNEIKAETIGTIKKVLVEDVHPVEYLQPLFEVEPD